MTKTSACLVTRGDVPLDDILSSLDACDVIDDVNVWDNSKRQDLAVYGRYAVIAEAKHDLIYVQDDDCIVSDLPALMDAYQASFSEYPAHNFVVCNMPPEFRHTFYEGHALVGFGAVFHRDAPKRAFYRFGEAGHSNRPFVPVEFFYRTCDVTFTTLTPRVLVDVPHRNLWWAEDPTRMYRQPNHVRDRQKMFEICCQIRDTKESEA